MANIIDSKKCTNCRICVERCPESVYGLDENGDVFVKRPDECWFCGSCQMDCPAGALKVKYDVNTAPLYFPITPLS
jgi:NAD-dependent dihydropyrimidine dehydrogenase PreA subunit